MGEYLDCRELERWAEFAVAHLPPRTGGEQRLVLFHARWRLAWCFQELAAPGYSDGVRDGYSAAFKVFLAYTAHEQFAESVGMPHWTFTLDCDPGLAADLRQNLAGIRGALFQSARGKQADGLTAFWKGESDDVRIIAFALRNVVAHGPFTGSKLRTRKSRVLVGRLAETLLLADERWFGQWLDMGLSVPDSP